MKTKREKAAAVNSGLTAKKRVVGKPFPPGVSGNPSGRPAVPASVVEAARAHTQAALDTLAEICEHGEDEKARITAAVALLDRAWGKSIEHTAITDDRAPLEAVAVVLTEGERAERVAVLLAKAAERKAASAQPAIAGPGGGA